MVSPLNGYQYDGDNFKYRGDKNNYSQRAMPQKGVRIMNVSGTKDGLVPYEGGASKRIPAKDGKLTFLSAERSTYLWAQAMGFKGEQLSKGEEVGKNVECFSYLDGAVQNYKILNGGHGAGYALEDALYLKFLLDDNLEPSIKR